MAEVLSPLTTNATLKPSIIEVPEHAEITRPFKFIYSDLPRKQGLHSISLVDDALNDFKKAPNANANAGAGGEGGSVGVGGYCSEKDIAMKVKRGFESAYGGTWQAIVGTCYGCSLTHKTKAVCHFHIQHDTCIMYVLLFQSDE